MVFPELLKRLQTGASTDNLPGLYHKGKKAPVRRAFAKDLNAFPLPDPALLAKSLTGAKDAPVPVQTRRGCPMACSYCSTPTIEGKCVRFRLPESVVAWIRQWVDQGFNYFYFVDNTFNLPPSYAAQLSSRIISAGLNISWRCILFPGGLSAQLIDTIARAGCREVSIGFESGNGGMLQRMKKQFSLSEVRNAAEMLRQHNIRRMGFLLLGGPGETRETVEESLAFAESLNLDTLKVSLGIRIYPGSDLARRALDEGLIRSEKDLVFPRFYLAPGMEDWLADAVAQRVAANSGWM
jgi:radical SAM superfamily enzyme YgiQ (UPF0313 family)